MKYLALSILAIRAIGCLALFAGKSFVNALHPPGLNFPVILAVNLCFVLNNMATRAIDYLVR